MKLTVGSNVDGWCTKCKLVLAHTIEALVGAEIKRVHCNTCGGKHSYRPYEPGSQRGSSRKISDDFIGEKKSKTPAGMVKASDYDKMMQGRSIQAVRSYSIRDNYQTGELLQHSLFGVGIVTVDKGSNKVEVLFQEGPKVLLHGKSPSL